MEFPPFLPHTCSISAGEDLVPATVSKKVNHTIIPNYLQGAIPVSNFEKVTVPNLSLCSPNRNTAINLTL